MALTDPTPGVIHIGESVGLSDDELLAMYRDGRARARGRRADVGAQPRRQHPVRHQRAGSRGRPGRDHLAAAQEARLDRAVLPLHRVVPDVRHECPRHHDRAVRDRRRPIVGRPPDAGPLRRPRQQSRIGQLAGRDPDPACGRDRPGGAHPALGAGRGHVHGRGHLQPGRLARGPQLRRHPPIAVRATWSRTTATPSACRCRKESRWPTWPLARPDMTSPAMSSTAPTCSSAIESPSRRSIGHEPARDRPSSRPR